jgi:hypothetical protein
MIKVSEFVKTVPQVARKQLPRHLQGFNVFLMPWLSQVYYDDKRLHYEVVKLPPKYGENRLEVGLHFESKDKTLNDMLLAGFDRHLFEIRAALGDDWWAEPWDKDWTKVYTTRHYQVMDEQLLEEVAAQLARTITIMQPIYDVVCHRKHKGDGKRR